MDIFESWLVNDIITKYGYVTKTEPENTIGAYNNSIKSKNPIFISVEGLDDGNIICCAHKNISSITDQNGYVQTLSLDDVKDLTVNKTEYKIPQLKTALKTINGKVPVIINILNDGNVGKIESNILNTLETYVGDIAISSPNPYVLEWFKNNAPDILRGIKSGKFSDKYYGSIKSKKLTKLKFCKISEPDFIIYNACDLPNKYVKKYSVLPIIAYDVKNEHEYLDVVKYCDNVIVDGFIPKI